MGAYLHLVFSIPPASVSETEFNLWYRTHLSEILITPGWDAARRYRLARANDAVSPTDSAYLAAYEVGPDIAANMAALALGFDERRAGGPSWVSLNRYASWNCAPLADDGDLTLPDRLILVFSAPPHGVTFEDYDAWFQRYAADTAPDAAIGHRWCFRLESSTVDERFLSLQPTHLAIFEREGHDPEELGDFGQIAGAVGPEWEREIPLARIVATALTERVTS